MTKTNRLQYVLISGLAFMFIWMLFGVNVSEAAHSTRSAGTVTSGPCSALDDISAETLVSAKGSHGSGSKEVPVYDDDTQKNLTKVITVLNGISDFTRLTEWESRKATGYLQALCQKEYEADHNLQHAWANLIGEFVAETQKFIHSGFNGNPAFITSQPAYYNLVEIAISRVFLQDISDSDIGITAKRAIIKAVAGSLYPYSFPYETPSGGFDLADEELPSELSENYNSEDYVTLLLSTGGISSSGFIRNAFAALKKRKEEQLTYEKEKLAWGRGFFSYEICDLNYQTDNREDRRNCRIATPGSLIQDQTSFVFGSALRQMELNDEYEEWIAPNTLAVLSDILSWRGFNNAESRSHNPAVSSPFLPLTSPTNAVSPLSLQTPGTVNYVDIEGVKDFKPKKGTQSKNPIKDGPLPYEFNKILDVEIFDTGSAGVGQKFFKNFLDPDKFLFCLDSPNDPICR